MELNFKTRKISEDAPLLHLEFKQPQTFQIYLDISEKRNHHDFIPSSAEGLEILDTSFGQELTEFNVIDINVVLAKITDYKSDKCTFEDMMRTRSLLEGFSDEQIKSLSNNLLFIIAKEQKGYVALVPADQIVRIQIVEEETWVGEEERLGGANSLFINSGWGNSPALVKIFHDANFSNDDEEYS